MLGGVLVVAGAMTDMAWGTRKDESHAFEALQGHWPTGVALGLLAALCQAAGSFIAKPVMAVGVDPMAATVVRVGATCLAHLVLLWAGVAVARVQGALSVRVLGCSAGLSAWAWA